MEMVSGVITSGISRGIGRSPREVVSTEGAVALAFFAGAGLLTSALTKSPVWFIAGASIGVYLLFAIKVADQWEKAAVLRFGRYKGLRGPGLYFVIPVA